MKNKILKTFLFFVLFSALLITASFATEIKEDPSKYGSSAFIIGSTRFDAQQIITADKLFDAGINEKDLYDALGKDIKKADKTLYYYVSEKVGWLKVAEETTNLTESETKKLEENLNIFFVNNEVKSVEVKFQGNVDKDSLPSNVEYDQEKGIFTVPATTFNFTFTETKVVNGEEVVIANEVSTNVDKNVTTGTNEIPVVEEPSKNYVAKVGNEYFEDLASAIAKATVENEVVLIENVELKEGLEITNTVTLNLNGKTLSANKYMESLALIKVKGGNLTINGEGTVNSASQGNDYSMAVWATGEGIVTINGGAYTNVGAKSVEDNGTTPNNNELIYANGSGKIYINGGTFTGNTENAKWGTRYTLNLKDQDNKVATIVVTGGTFTAYDPANSKSENPTANLVAEGYKSVEDGNTYKVLPYDANNVTHEAELRALIAKGGTITLGGDIDLKTAVVVSKVVTLNLNGKTLTAKTDTVGDGIFTVITGGDLTINGEGTIDSACLTNDYSMAIWAKETGKVTINGGTYTNLGAKDTEDDGDANNNELIYARHNAQIVINGGTFIGNTANKEHKAKYTLNLKDAENETASIIVKGGTFTGYNPASSASENPRMNFLADGYKVVVSENDNSEKEYMVKPIENTDVFLADGISCIDIQKALDTASTVKFLENTDIYHGLVVSTKVTVDLNGKTLSATQDEDGNGIFKVIDGGDLTITGDGVINSACQTNDYSMALWVTGTGKATINNGTFTNVGAKDFEDDGTTPNNNELIYASGSGKIYINGGTFIGNTENETYGARYTLNLKDKDNKVATIVVKGGTFTAYDPANSKSENPTANLVADGYVSVEKDGIYTVSKAN